MNDLLEPSLYIGRCAEQVDALVEKVKPMISGLNDGTVQIEL